MIDQIMIIVIIMTTITTMMMQVPSLAITNCHFVKIAIICLSHQELRLGGGQGHVVRRGGHREHRRVDDARAARVDLQTSGNMH
jgi:hypothetical protein